MVQVDEILQAQAVARRGLLCDLPDAGVEHVLGELPAQQVFGRQVVDEIR
jgi:hypothetical protein